MKKIHVIEKWLLFSVTPMIKGIGRFTMEKDNLKVKDDAEILTFENKQHVNAF